jgi:hypothetical protein
MLLTATYQRQGDPASGSTKQVPFLYEESLIDLSSSHVNTTSHMTPTWDSENRGLESVKTEIYESPVSLLQFWFQKNYATLLSV